MTLILTLDVADNKTAMEVAAAIDIASKLPKNEDLQKRLIAQLGNFQVLTVQTKRSTES